MSLENEQSEINAAFRTVGTKALTAPFPQGDFTPKRHATNDTRISHQSDTGHSVQGNFHTEVTHVAWKGANQEQHFTS